MILSLNINKIVVQTTIVKTIIVKTTVVQTTVVQTIGSWWDNWKIPVGEQHYNRSGNQ